MQAIELTKLSGKVKARSSLSSRGTIRKAQSLDFQSAGITATAGTRLANCKRHFLELKLPRLLAPDYSEAQILP